MNFFVDWNENARNGLASAWISSSDRNAITKAEAKIDRLLSLDPFSHGEPLAEGLFAINVPPLRVTHEVSEDEQKVYVVALAISRP